jgi:hypothetical protein
MKKPPGFRFRNADQSHSPHPPPAIRFLWHVEAHQASKAPVGGCCSLASTSGGQEMAYCMCSLNVVGKSNSRVGTVVLVVCAEDVQRSMRSGRFCTPIPRRQSKHPPFKPVTGTRYKGEAVSYFSRPSLSPNRTGILKGKLRNLLIHHAIPVLPYRRPPLYHNLPATHANPMQ